MYRWLFRRPRYYQAGFFTSLWVLLGLVSDRILVILRGGEIWNTTVWLPMTVLPVSYSMQPRQVSQPEIRLILYTGCTDFRCSYRLEL